MDYILGDYLFYESLAVSPATSGIFPCNQYSMIIGTVNMHQVSRKASQLSNYLNPVNPNVIKGIMTSSIAVKSAIISSNVY